MVLSLRTGGILGFLLLVADIWAIVSVTSSSATTGKKVLWILLVLCFPGFGFVLWFLLGPKAR